MLPSEHSRAPQSRAPRTLPVAALSLLAGALLVLTLAFRAARAPAAEATPTSPVPASSLVVRPTRSGPVLTLLDPVYDWGSVVAGPEIVHTFHVRNDGDAPLVIRRAKPT